VHVVRDGRDVACSAMAQPGGPRTVDAAARAWVMATTRVTGLDHRWPGAVHTVRYEDLVTRPGPVLAALESALALSPGAIHSRLRTPLYATRIGRWTRELGYDEVDAFQAVGGELLDRFGYDLSTWEGYALAG
jgi:hypothetical protein